MKNYIRILRNKIRLTVLSKQSVVFGAAEGTRPHFALSGFESPLMKQNVHTFGMHVLLVRLKGHVRIHRAISYRTVQDACVCTSHTKLRKICPRQIFFFAFCPLRVQVPSNTKSKSKHQTMFGFAWH